MTRAACTPGRPWSTTRRSPRCSRSCGRSIGLPGPLTGVTEVVVDANSSGADPGRLRRDQGRYRRRRAKLEAGPAMKGDPGPASLQDIMYPLQRPTAIGRSQGTARERAAGDDPRGARPRNAVRPQHPPARRQRPRRGRDRALLRRRSIRRRVAAAVAAVSARRAARRHGAGAGGAAPAISHALDDPDTHTEVPLSRSKAFAKVIALIGGVAVVGVAWFAWTNMRGTAVGPDPTAAPAAAAGCATRRARDRAATGTTRRCRRPRHRPSDLRRPPAPAREGAAPAPAPAAAAPPTAGARRRAGARPCRRRPRRARRRRRRPTAARRARPRRTRRRQSASERRVRRQGRRRRPAAGEQAQPKPPPPRPSWRIRTRRCRPRCSSARIEPAIPSDFAALVWYP